MCDIWMEYVMPSIDSWYLKLHESTQIATCADVRAFFVTGGEVFEGGACA